MTAPLSFELAVDVTADDVLRTLQDELQRRQHREQMIKTLFAKSLEEEAAEDSVCSPQRGYCASCPVANALWRLAPDALRVSVDGVGAELNFKEKPTSSVYRTKLPSEVQNWIDYFDDWIGFNSEDDYETSVDAAESLIEDLDYPALPDTFVLRFDRC